MTYICFMSGLIERYVNPFTDFGFKKLFGEEINKDLLLDFLNQLLRDEQGEILSLQYLKSEHLGGSALDRRAIFDLYCENEKGEKFIVELQKSKQNFFKDRSVYYSTFPIQQQSQRGSWNFELQSVYTIAILDFVFEEDKAEQDKYLYKVKLTDIDTCKVFYDKLTFIYLEMPKFDKGLTQLESQFDKWLYVLKHLPDLQERPIALQERVFEKLFIQAEIAGFTKEEREAYEDSLKYYRDLKNVIDTARDEGREEGRIEGREEGRIEGKQEGREEGKFEEKLNTARKLKEQGFDTALIAKITGLSQEEINSI